MTTTRVDAVIDALVSLFDGALAATVYDGIPFDDFAGYGTYVIVGGDDTWGEEWHIAASATQTWHDLGPSATRDEVITVPCVIAVFSGDDDMQTARAAAATTLGACETAVRGSLGLGLPDLIAQTEVSTTTWRYRRGPEGTTVRVEFTVAARALI